jgi:DNA-binding HxlR family transcriptional regulator
MKEGTRKIDTHQMVTNAMTEHETSCDDITDEQDDFAREMLERVSGKWSLYVLHELANAGQPLRFSRVLQRVEGISQKVLTQTLRPLERDGLVTRKLYPQVPPRVDYALTPLGYQLLEQIYPLWRWMIAHIADFEAAREKA